VSRTRPPLLARALLRARVGNEAVGQAIQGDLWQEYLARRQSSGRMAASSWYWREVLGVLRPRPFHPGRPERRLVGWSQDLGYAWRSLRRSPAYTILAISLLALGIGATTTIFTAANALFLRPPPHVVEPDRLMAVHTSDDGRRFSQSSYPDFVALRQNIAAFEDMTGYMLGMELTLEFDDDLRAAFGAAVSSEYFRVFGARLALGRGFDAEETGPFAADDVIVLSHRIWTDAFGASPDVLGQEIRVNGRQRRIVGVAPAGLQAPGFPVEVDAYVPLAGEWLAHRGSRGLLIMARLAVAAQPQAAQSQLDALATAIYEEDATNFSDRNGESRRFNAISEFEARLGAENRAPVMAFVTMLLVAVGLVLAIACSNLAHLALVRAGGRGGDLAIRRAVGAGQGRLVRLLILESLLVGLGGGLVGVMGVAWVTALISRIGVLPGGITLELGVDWRVVGFAIAVSSLTGALFGLAPARRIARLELTPLLHGGTAAGVISGRGRLRSTLVVMQVAGSVVLVAVAGLFFRSLQGAVNADVGFDPEGIAVVRTDLEQIRMGTDEGLALFDQLRDQLSRRPDVESVVLAARVPLAGSWSRMDVEIEGYEPADGHSAMVSFHEVSAGYFDQMRIPLLLGREFNDGDRAGALPVVIVNEVFAQRYWPGEPALERSITFGATAYQVVGVVAETRGRQLGEDPLTQIWVSMHQNYRQAMMLQVRTRSAEPSGEFLAAVRDAVTTVAPELPVLDPVWMPSMTANATLPQRIASSVLGAAGAMALLLAALGLHGVVAFGVSQRIPEIGLRMALGADRGAVFRVVLAGALRLIAAGMVVGIGIAVVAGRLVSDLLVGTSPLDPMALGIAVLGLGLAAAVGCIGPVRRATRIDPVTALRAL